MRLPTPLTIARATVAWAVIFAVVHVYWAAGGDAGMNGEPADTLAAQVYIGFIAAVGLAGGAVAHGLTHGWGGRRVLLLLARAGGLALLVGVAVGTGRWVADGSLDGDGAAGIVTTLYFLLGGLLFSALSWRISPSGSGRACAAPA